MEFAISFTFEDRDDYDQFIDAVMGVDNVIAVHGEPNVAIVILGSPRSAASSLEHVSALAVNFDGHLLGTGMFTSSEVPA